MIGRLRVDSRNRALLTVVWRRGSGIAGIVVLNKLPEFFFKRHPAEQAIYSGLEDWIRELGVASPTIAR